MPAAIAVSERPHSAGNSEAGRPAVAWDVVLAAVLWCWAIWSCAEHWRANPNYSYGWAVPALALGFALRRYLVRPAQDLEAGASSFAVALPISAALGSAAAILVGALEFARLQVWHPQIVLTAICLLAVFVTCALLFLRGGWRTVAPYLFPVLFFLTALPWPPRFEQPLTSQLMVWVASVTVEILQLSGFEATRSGGAIALSTGLVGVTEACSGIRSLQAGLMFGLAMGEWFLLRTGRRIALVAGAVLLALATNLGRTVALCLQAEWYGPAAVETAHDFIGTVAMTSLIGSTWLLGRLLQTRSAAAFDINWREKFARLARTLRFPPAGSAAAVVLAFTLVGLMSARGLYRSQSARDQTQTAPFFAVRQQERENQPVAVPPDIWRELNPTSGTYVRRQDSSLPRGFGEGYHFFWKPSPWNRFVLVHRPDICMPGIGWQLAADPVPITVRFGEKEVRFHAFSFRRENAYALALWGAWRNGQPVTIDYKPGDVLGANGAPPPVELQGKRRSATEIVACSLVSEGQSPPVEVAVALLQSIFEHHPR